MRKNLSTLASQALHVQGSLQAQLLRIQGGFLPKTQIAAAQKTARDILEMLQEMEKAMTSPPPPSAHTLPLK